MTVILPRFQQTWELARYNHTDHTEHSYETPPSTKSVTGWRADAYPEEITYKDDGCQYSPKCVECPLPQCKFDGDPKSLPRRTNGVYTPDRDAAIYAAKQSGMTVANIMTAFGIARRNVFKALERHKMRLANGDAGAFA